MAAQGQAAAGSASESGGSPAASAAAAAAAAFPATSLYVGDLHESVQDAQLFDVFSQVGGVVSVRVCRDINSRKSLGYAYVNYNNTSDAARALELLNFTPINGKPIRIMYSNRDPSSRKSGAGNIFIKNLDKSIDNKALYDTFCAFGNILSCKIATDPSGESRGYGFVQFEMDESAQSAIDKLNGMLINDKKVYVGPFVRKQDRENVSNNIKFSNVYVKNLSDTVTDDELKEMFGKYGTITSAVVMRDSDGNSRCFGFVNFENADAAAQAVQELNGKIFNDKELYVGRAQKKSEREMELKEKFEKNIQEVAEKFQNTNLYLKNLDDNIDDEKLREIFAEYGNITSCKVMRDSYGVSRGSGFVSFKSAEDANRALTEMNGKMVGSKPLYVALAQRKDDRKAKLQAQFSQMRPVAMAPSVGPRMPMFPPSVPGVGQQLFYGQPPPAFINPQQGQQPQRPAGRRAGSGGMQQPMPMGSQQQIFPRGGRGYRYATGRGMPDPGMHNVGAVMPSPYEMGGMAMRDAGVSQPVPIGALATALANASPDQQRLMLGENLYPLVEQLEREQAAKVTGMLLEMDQTEVLHLLESPDALKAKVAEAMEVLRSAQHLQQSNASTEQQLANLSLNDGVLSS
ncbi:Polyadenylate-binding protein 2 [Zea mays]|uniref:Polyadenylate-binding protein n=1 Tax=Zea mays TaxID=4577 RepID=A0A1D6I0G6_MAIZE|nr:Polyadenylate-binding protein 2 [Zea mays]